MQVEASNPQQGSRVQRISRIVLFLIGAAFIFVGAWIFTRQLKYASDPHSDFGLYYQSARNLLEGKSIYADEYFNTPLLTVLVLPFALLPLPIASTLWSLVSLGSYIGTGRIVLCALRVRLSVPALLVVLGLGLCWFPFEEGISLGQVSVLLAFITLSGWALLKRDKPAAAGVFFGFAAALKLFPGLILIYLLARKKWKAAVWTALGAVGFTLLSMLIAGWQDSLRFVTTIILSPSPFSAIPLNLSIKGIADRLFADSYWVEPVVSSPSARTLITIGAYLLVAGIFLVQLFRLPRTKDGEDRAFAVTLFAMMLLSPITWPHNFPFLILGFGLLLKELIETRNLWLMRLGLVLLILACIPNLEIAKVLMVKHTPDRIPWMEGLVFLLPTFVVVLSWLLISLKLPFLPMKVSQRD
jgi:alpha-1,2-mannosyltransferase